MCLEGLSCLLDVLSTNLFDSTEAGWGHTVGVCQQAGPAWCSVSGGHQTGIGLGTREYSCAIHPLSQSLQLDSIKTHHWQILACSAVTGENLLSGIHFVISDISSRIFTMD